MARRSARLRFGLSSSPVSHFSVTSPNARMFHVAMTRLWSTRFAGTASSSASLSTRNSSATPGGGAPSIGRAPLARGVMATVERHYSSHACVPTAGWGQ